MIFLSKLNSSNWFTFWKNSDCICHCVLTIRRCNLIFDFDLQTKRTNENFHIQHDISVVIKVLLQTTQFEFRMHSFYLRRRFTSFLSFIQQAQQFRWGFVIKCLNFPTCIMAVYFLFNFWFFWQKTPIRPPNISWQGSKLSSTCSLDTYFHLSPKNQA